MWKPSKILYFLLEKVLVCVATEQVKSRTAFACVPSLLPSKVITYIMLRYSQSSNPI